jgi:hypothetical protein
VGKQSIPTTGLSPASPTALWAAEQSLTPATGTKVSARVWGTVIHQPDGRVASKPYFYGDHYAVNLPNISKVR